MTNIWKILTCVLAGFLVGAFVMIQGANFGIVAGVFVAEAVFCFGCIIFATRFMPELLSRHLDWQLRRRGR